MWKCIICNGHCICITHWKITNGSPGNPSDNWWWCLCMHLFYLFQFLKLWTQHAFVYDSYFTTTENSACQGAIIDNRRYAPICVMEEKDRKNRIKTEDYAWGILLRHMHCGACIQKYFIWLLMTYNRYLFIIILWFDLLGLDHWRRKQNWTMISW